jgi:hypothetical protein
VHSCGTTPTSAELTSRTSRSTHKDHTDERRARAGDLHDIGAHRASVRLLLVPIVVHAQEPIRAEVPDVWISFPLWSIQHHAHSSRLDRPAALGRHYKGYIWTQRNGDAGICKGQLAAWLGRQRRDESNAAQLRKNQ